MEQATEPTTEQDVVQEVAMTNPVPQPEDAEVTTEIKELQTREEIPIEDSTPVTKEIALLKPQQSKVAKQDKELPVVLDPAKNSGDWLSEKPQAIRILVQTGRVCSVFLALYFFLISLSLMGSGFSALSGKSAGGLFVGSDSPIVGLMIGILATVLVQSSSTTTSIIVVLVANQIVPVETAIPMIMGANIGTSVTSTIVSLGFVEDVEAYERGFAGATVHDMFNYLNVLLLLPLELLVSALRGPNGGGLLQTVAEKLTSIRGDETLDTDYKDRNPIKLITNPVTKKIIDINKDVITDHAQGFPEIPEGLIDGGECPEELIFDFQDDKTRPADCLEEACDFCPEGFFNETLYNEALTGFDNQILIKGGRCAELGDTTGGIVALVAALVMMIVSLLVIVKVLTILVRGAAQRILTKALNYDFVGGGYVSILLGIGITLAVQSSSITTSILTPLVAVGTLSLENMFPFTLGANIGTTGTGMIAAAGSGDPDGYTIALVHLFFNIFGTLIWYPVPRVRGIPIAMARFLGEMAAVWKVIPLIYIFMAFGLYPLIFFGFSSALRSGNTGGIVAGVFALVVFLAAHCAVVFWYKKRDGKNKFIKFVDARKARLGVKKESKADVKALVGAGQEVEMTV